MYRSGRLGIFVFSALLLLSTGIFLIGRKQLMFGHTYRIYAQFDSVAGLPNGAEVRWGGVPEGTVDDITLPISPGEKVTVAIDLNSSTSGLLRKNSVASIQTEGLLGSKYVRISSGSGDSAPLHDGDTIATVPPLDLSDLVYKSNEILSSTYAAVKNFNATSTDLKSITSKVNRGEGTLGELINDRTIGQQILAAVQSIRQSAVSLDSIAAKINNGNGPLGTFLNDSQMAKQIKTAVANTSQATSDMRAIVAKVNSDQGILGSLLDDAEFKQHFQATLSNLDQVSASLRSISSKLDQGQGTLGALINDKMLYQQVNNTTADLAAAMAEAKGGITAFHEDMEALKHNWFFKGFFKNRGYWDEAEVTRNAMIRLPKSPYLKKFVFSARNIFNKPDTAKLNNSKVFDEVGNFLARTPYRLVVVTAEVGVRGEPDKSLVLTEARAWVVRRYLVEKFKIEEDRIATKGMGEEALGPPDQEGRVEVIIYPGPA
jgi:phospholipid/cholesterol/gamma-HCH transport system substrate-binding protein